VNISAIAVLGALGLNILTGCTGQISLGHAAFMALGSYAAAILATSVGLPFWAAVPCAGLISAGAGILVGIPCLRLKGLYLAMATMAFGGVVEHLALHIEGVGGFQVGWIRTIRYRDGALRVLPGVEEKKGGEECRSPTRGVLQHEPTRP